MVLLSTGLGTATAQDEGFPERRPTRDTGQIIHLLNADTLLGIQGKDGDSASSQKLIGNVRLQQGGTIFTCDSALQYLSSNTIDAYGHIHINQQDTINTYSDFLHYEGNTKIATLKNNVKMSDGHMVLTTDYLTYDMNQHVGTYIGGGKLVNQQTILTSQRGYYYADSKDVYFKNQVKLNNPEYTLTTDTLLYNTLTHIATFLAPTAINTGGTVIYTSCGYYNTDQQYTHLCSQPSITDSSGTLTADTLDFDKATGIGNAYGNVHWSDTSGQVTVLSDYALSNRAQQSILATKDPLLMLAQKDDTLFVASDTLFSAPLRPTAADSMAADSLDYVYMDPLNPVARNYRDSLAAADSTRGVGLDSTGQVESLAALPIPVLPVYTLSDSVHLPANIALMPPARPRATEAQKTPEPEPAQIMEAQPSEVPPGPAIDSSALSVQAADSLPSLPSRGDSSGLRNMIAYHHVRLYSDSLQGVSDSLYYSDLDSAFRFHGDPVLWTGQTQLTGDTIVLETQNQQASRLLLEENAMIVNKVGPNQYNQIKGNIIIGYFGDSSQLEWMDVKGNAECIYYAQEDNGAFVGVNHTTAATIRLYFKNNQLNKVVFYKSVSGTFQNPLGIKAEETRLEGFRWEVARRPQSKADLFERKNQEDATRPSIRSAAEGGTETTQ